MKRIAQYIMLIALVVLTTLPTQARTFTVDVSSATGDLTQYLREKVKVATRSDTVLLKVGKGEYTINGTVEFKCNAVIKGAGRDLSTIVFNNGSDRNGFKAFTDDTFLMFHGLLEQSISVDISDVSFRLKEHKGIWWNDAGDKSQEKYAVKIYHAHRVNIHRVNSYLSNAIITNYDLRICSNVDITDCIISNYNNTHTGGNLWIRGEMHNINVKRNKFYKYGNDEIIAVFSNIVNNKGIVRWNANRTDIYIEDNVISYGYDGKDKDPSMVNHTLFTLQTGNDEGKWVTTTRNFNVRNNIFRIKDQTARCIFVSLPVTDRHQGICFDGNKIIHENLHSSKQYYRQDIEISDKTKSQDAIRIINNTVTNNNPVLNPSKTIGYSFLLMQGGNVEMNDNKIVSTVTKDPYTGKECGVQLVWCGADGGIVTMRNNVCKGIKCISTVGAGEGTKHFTLNAFNNYFVGDTRVYCHKVERLDINFTGNTLICDNMNFFLQEFATKGSVVFNNNEVKVSSGDGRFMTHWAKTSTDDMRFEKLEVKNNVFQGVKSEQDMFKKMTNVKKRSIRSNTIR
ncbi:MAG: hypothetical protein J6S96_08250 [Muribaculaceae bacterium]|nr:hypothetical protein [Muribaculaceae bacterium]